LTPPASVDDRGEVRLGDGLDGAALGGDRHAEPPDPIAVGHRSIWASPHRSRSHGAGAGPSSCSVTTNATKRNRCRGPTGTPI